jgi:hypothetical protein
MRQFLQEQIILFLELVRLQYHNTYVSDLFIQKNAIKISPPSLFFNHVTGCTIIFLLDPSLLAL